MELPDQLALPLPGARVRALREDDWPLEQALSRVPDVPRWTYYQAELSVEGARDRVDRSLALRADGRGARFVVEHGGAPVGTVGLELRTDVPSVYYAFLPAGRGLGLATEAVRAVAALGPGPRCGRGPGVDAARQRRQRTGPAAGVVPA